MCADKTWVPPKTLTATIALEKDMGIPPEENQSIALERLPGLQGDLDDQIGVLRPVGHTVVCLSTLNEGKQLDASQPKQILIIQAFSVSSL